MVQRAWWGALWFGRSQPDKENKQTNKQPSLIDRWVVGWAIVEHV